MNNCETCGFFHFLHIYQLYYQYYYISLKNFSNIVLIKSIIKDISCNIGKFKNRSIEEKICKNQMRYYIKKIVIKKRSTLNSLK